MRSVEIVEVSPRDGLQNEKVLLSTAQKLALIDRAISAGVRRMEATSFVHPKLVPQMADAEAVAAALPRRGEITYIGLVLNKQGALRAIKAGLDELGAVCSASDGFGLKNQGMTSEQSLAACADILKLAREAGRRAHITITTAFGCPFDGEVDPDHVVRMAMRAAEAGSVEVGVADTIGVAAPGEVEALVAQVVKAVAPVPVRVHFHNTRNTGLANVWAGVKAGAATVDASIGGIGGCPFAPRATGNVPTEDVIYMLERSGVATNLSLPAVAAAAEWLSGVMGRELPGTLSKVGWFPRAKAVGECA